MNASNAVNVTINHEVDEGRNNAGSNLNLLPRARRSIFQPIVYGNMATQLEKPNIDNHTHKWCLYLKPYLKNCDLTRFIRKVVFVLEPHYRNETLVTPPFIVNRTGWGEFTAQIKIYSTFSSRALILTHWLGLVDHSDKNDDSSKYRYVPFVRYEDYNEIVIEDPTDEQRLAMQTGSAEPEPEFGQFKVDRERTMRNLVKASQMVAVETKRLKQMIFHVRNL